MGAPVGSLLHYSLSHRPPSRASANHHPRTLRYVAGRRMASAVNTQWSDRPVSLPMDTAARAAVPPKCVLLLPMPDVLAWIGMAPVLAQGGSTPFDTWAHGSDLRQTPHPRITTPRARPSPFPASSSSHEFGLRPASDPLLPPTALPAAFPGPGSPERTIP